MKTRLIYLAGIIAAAMLFSCISAANAQTLYGGAKVVWVRADVTGFDNTFGGGVYGGLQLPPIDNLLGANAPSLPIGLAIEGEAITTLIEGDTSFTGVSGDWKVTTVAVYGVGTFDLADILYLKGRLGLIYGKGEGSFSGASWSNTDWGISGGVGGGLKLGARGAVEAEVTGIAEDLLYVTVGYRYTF